MIESGTGRMDCKFVTSRRESLIRHTDPRSRGHMILSENLSLAFLAKKEIHLTQSWAVGFSILDISKHIMQSLMYDVVKPAFGGQASVLLSDTDSWVLAVPAKSSDEAMQKLKNVMDFSNYPVHHHLFDGCRKNRPGYLKNEIPDDEIREVVGVRSKTYAIRTCKTTDTKCKGVKKAAKKEIPFSAFRDCVLGTEKTRMVTQQVTQYSIQSRKHQNRLVKSVKVAFTTFDDKRYLFPCGVHSVPYGSRLIKKRGGACVFCADSSLLC